MSSKITNHTVIVDSDKLETLANQVKCEREVTTCTLKQRTESKEYRISQKKKTCSSFSFNKKIVFLFRDHKVSLEMWMQGSTYSQPTASERHMKSAQGKKGNVNVRWKVTNITNKYRMGRRIVGQYVQQKKKGICHWNITHYYTCIIVNI